MEAIEGQLEGIEEVALNHLRWRDAAEGVVYDNWYIEDEVERAAALLTDQVLNGDITARNLRRGLFWANALDAEAVELYGSDLSSGNMRVERTARRIMHHSGRMALKGVKTHKKRTAAIANRAARERVMVG